MPDIRLIERWLPIAEIGAESLRERTPMTPFPAPNRLHVWWARRPLVASRAAILASLLPDGVDRAAFLRVLGVHGDPIAAQARIAEARRRGERFEGSAYGYGRAFRYVPDDQDKRWLDSKLGGGLDGVAILDPTAGGGAIPLEAVRVGAAAAANSTVFLACRPRPAERAAEARDAVVYWEDVEPRVAKAVRTRVAEFQQAGIAGVDLYLACFGPALEEFSRNWPLTRGTPRARPAARRGQQDVLEDDWDPYAATPEDALDAARREVKRWRLEQLTRKKVAVAGIRSMNVKASFTALATDESRGRSAR